jgi:hypothetical protein
MKRERRRVPSLVSRARGRYDFLHNLLHVWKGSRHIWQMRFKNLELCHGCFSASLWTLRRRCRHLSTSGRVRGGIYGSIFVVRWRRPEGTLKSRQEAILGLLICFLAASFTRALRVVLLCRVIQGIRSFSWRKNG